MRTVIFTIFALLAAVFESYLASTVISTCGKSPHLKIIQKINHRLALLAA